jgi:DNA-binding GntR family transcriptional regulator
MVTPVQRSSLAVEVTKKLRAEILNGSIKPGQRILEQEISNLMKTSRGPVRDALIQLEHDGLVVREPNRSATVVSMSADDVEEVHSLRLSLEMLALRYVIERAQEEDLDRLQQAVESLRSCLEDGYSLQEAVDLDLRFHEEFVKTARHHRLLSMWQSIKPQIWFLIFTRNAYAKEYFRDAIVTHEELLNEIRRKDFEKGGSIVKEHLDAAYASLIASYRQTHPPGGHAS